MSQCPHLVIAGRDPANPVSTRGEISTSDIVQTPSVTMAGAGPPSTSLPISALQGVDGGPAPAMTWSDRCGFSGYSIGCPRTLSGHGAALLMQASLEVCGSGPRKPSK